MHYDIKLPTQVSGTELIEGLKMVVGRLGWSCTTSPASYYCSVPTDPRKFFEAKIEATALEVKLYKNQTIIAEVNPPIVLKKKYSTLSLLAREGAIPEESLKELTLRLYHYHQLPD